MSFLGDRVGLTDCLLLCHMPASMNYDNSHDKTTVLRDFVFMQVLYQHNKQYLVVPQKLLYCFFSHCAL